MRVLVVEDDGRMRAVVRRGLAEQAHVVQAAATGAEAAALLAVATFDVIVLDVMLPDTTGLEFVRELRRGGRHTPVLMLTARDTVDDVTAGLDAGADDYLVKPFAFKVLLARLRALGRRPLAVDAPVRQIADLVLDEPAHAVTRGGVPVALTRTEYALLDRLIRHAGRVVTRSALLDLIGGGRHEVESNTLDAFIKSLRQKVEVPGRPRLIHTIRGVGYSLRDEAEE